MKTLLKIKPTGTLEFLGAPPASMKLLTDPARRFSTIVPFFQPERSAFVVLRLLFGERGWVAAWTRRWRCVWIARVLLGPHCGETRLSENREYLLDWERTKWRDE